MSYLRAGILRLFESGKRVSDISRLSDIPKQTVSYVVKRFRETGSNKDRQRSCHPKTATTTPNCGKIRGRVKRNPQTKKIRPESWARQLVFPKVRFTEFLRKISGTFLKRKLAPSRTIQLNHFCGT